MNKASTNATSLVSLHENETSHLLLQHTYLQISIDLAKILGLNEAIVIQRLHDLIEESSTFFDGYYWVHKTYNEWQQQHFPFWSTITVSRTFLNLEKKELVLSENRMLNRYLMDKE